MVPKEANRGGLIINWNGVRGFLPASQLSEKNYPKVLNVDKTAILNELKKLIGTTVTVKLITAEPQNERLIFSEHSEKIGSLESSGGSEKVKYEVGDIAAGIITGIVEFGLFVKIDDSTQGLVHISEISWGLVNDPRKFHSVGDNVTVKIISVDDEKYSLSIKALEKNPWQEVGEKYKVGDTVKGVIIKQNQHGAFASIESGVSGLIHISNYKDEDGIIHDS